MGRWFIGADPEGNVITWGSRFQAGLRAALRASHPVRSAR
jgi:hypothetical protein